MFMSVIYFSWVFLFFGPLISVRFVNSSKICNVLLEIESTGDHF